MKNRKSNIELLRIFAVLGVIILHYKNPEMGGGMAYVTENSINYHLLLVLESMFVCAVDVFVLISGYFLCTSKRRSLWKPIKLITQVMLFGLASYLVRSIFIGFSIKSMIGNMIPANYYVILYVTVYIISPYINVVFENVTKKQMRLFAVASFALFSVYPTLVDIFSEITGNEWMGLSTIGILGDQSGYTIVTFVLMYILGAYLRLGENTLKTWSTRLISGILLTCIVILTLWAKANLTFRGLDGSAYYYCNPVVIFMAMLMFELFSRFEIKNDRMKKLINIMAEGVFSVFLLHSHFLKYINIEMFVRRSLLIMLMHIVVSSGMIYTICWCVHIVYHKITDPLFGKLAGVLSVPSIDLNDDFNRRES